MVSESCQSDPAGLQAANQCFSSDGLRSSLALLAFMADAPDCAYWNDAGMPPPMGVPPSGAPPLGPPGGAPDAKRQRTGGLVLEAEEEFLAKYPGPSKVLYCACPLQNMLCVEPVLPCLASCLEHISSVQLFVCTGCALCSM